MTENSQLDAMKKVKKNRDIEYEVERERAIKKELDCEIIRFNLVDHEFELLR